MRCYCALPSSDVLRVQFCKSNTRHPSVILRMSIFVQLEKMVCKPKTDSLDNAEMIRGTRERADRSTGIHISARVAIYDNICSHISTGESANIVFKDSDTVLRTSVDLEREEHQPHERSQSTGRRDTHTKGVSPCELVATSIARNCCTFIAIA